MVNVYVQKKRVNVLNAQHDQKVNDLLSESERAIRAGNKQLAYELALRATEVAPNNVDAWFLRATLAPSLEERLISVNALNELNPDHHDRHHVAFFAVKEVLDKDPFLAYLEETDSLYRVINKKHMVLTVPKKRAVDDSAVLKRNSPLKAAYRLLTLAIFGLLLAGIGTLIFAPLAALAALGTGTSLRSRAERVSATLVVILSGVLFLLGLFLGYIFLIHLLG
jgi:hypothetical protein